MLKGTPILSLAQPAGILSAEDVASALVHILEHGRVDLVFGHQVGLAELAAEVIGGVGVAEAQRLGAPALRAEDDHVGEVGGVVDGDVFAEDAAGGEDRLDGADC